MEIVTGLIIELSRLMRPFLAQIATAFVIAFLVVAGDSVNRVVRRKVSGFYFPFRVLAFILLCFFGYGAASTWAIPWISRFLSRLNPLYVSPLVLASFTVVGIMAERKKRI